MMTPKDRTPQFVALSGSRGALASSNLGPCGAMKNPWDSGRVDVGQAAKKPGQQQRPTSAAWPQAMYGPNKWFTVSC